jgi:NAD(P)-dependent dehydrogenase (short-subunit alcohol dehydrogenase family)
VARVLITGSTTGLGEGAARRLLDAGHEVVVHARNMDRARSIGALTRRATGLVVGDLASAAETRGITEQVNNLGGVDAVIHNAGIYIDAQRIPTPDGHARTLAVNVLAPYLLTAWMQRPSRLVYISSGMHTSGHVSLNDIDWTARRWDGVQAYCDSKLFVTTLALALARRWPGVCVNTVDPGWVPTRMGGAAAPDNLELGHATQAWLAVSDNPEATTTGGYWYHQQRGRPVDAAVDERFQEQMLDELARLTGVQVS